VGAASSQRLSNPALQKQFCNVLAEILLIASNDKMECIKDVYTDSEYSSPQSKEEMSFASNFL
jgi:hypothetical protein